MTISGNLTTSFTKPAELQRTYQPQQQSVAAQSPKPSLARRFDSVTISGENSRIFESAARGQLASELRSVPSSGSLSALRDEIERGTYQPDSMEIAKKMLLFAEG